MAWKASLRIDMALVVETIRQMPANLCGKALIHSDQGFHYTNPSFIAAVKAMKMDQSMSGKGNCIDNASIESFFGHMKDELDYASCASFKELLSKIEEYMQYYNYERKQRTRNKMTPVSSSGLGRGLGGLKVSTKGGTHHQPEILKVGNSKVFQEEQSHSNLNKKKPLGKPCGPR